MSDAEDTSFSGLLDAVSRHRAAPHSFSIPRSDVRRSLEPGDTVKLLFGFGGGDEPSAERMWVEVIDRACDVEGADGEGVRYVGRLLNRPEVIHDLAPGAIIGFGPEHVAATYREVPGAPEPEQLAIVSDRIRAGEPPAHAHRVAAPDARFSGWLVSAGSDGPAPPADLAGYRPMSHAELRDRFRSVDSIEDEAPGSAWQWDPDALEWTPRA